MKIGSDTIVPIAPNAMYHHDSGWFFYVSDHGTLDIADGLTFTYQNQPIRSEATGYGRGRDRFIVTKVDDDRMRIVYQKIA